MSAPPATLDHPAAALERLVMQGDLSKLSPEGRLAYYTKVCESLGLNPWTQPFAYITLNGKLTLYARRDCTEQLRRRDGVSIERLERELVEGVYVVTAYARGRDGRVDSSTGAVSVDGLTGEPRANAMMKAETKAKRRVTLSICGLGCLDESEVADLPAPAAPPREAPPVEPTAPPSRADWLRGRADRLRKANKPLGHSWADVLKLLGKPETTGLADLPDAEYDELIATLERQAREAAAPAK